MVDYKVTVEAEDNGIRLDIFLSQRQEELSRNYIQTLIEKGNVQVNCVVESKKKYQVKKGDTIEICLPEPEHINVEPENIDLNIVYEDNDLIVINKPQGMVVHPAPGNYSGTLVNALLYHFKDNLSSINGVKRPGIVHRIDKDTSGLLVVAKNDKAHCFLSDQLAKHEIQRIYEAFVYNNIKDDEGTIDLPIGRDPKNRLKFAVINDGKEAITYYKVLERYGRYTHIELRLKTGRTHQIRVHMAHINHPLIGDKVYGPKRGIGDGQYLHARKLGFVHPESKEYIEFEAEPPENFIKLKSKFLTGIL